MLIDTPALHQSSYRAAVASILNAIKADYGESDQDVAERIHASSATVNNACNKKGDLNAVTLLRIGREYGLNRLGPVMDLIGGKLAPREAVCTSDNHLPVGAARGQLFLAKAMQDERIDDHELIEGAADIEAAHETFGNLKWRLDAARRKRA